MDLTIDLKGNKVMTKSLTIDLEKAKYKKRTPKPGGGYRYVYDAGQESYVSLSRRGTLLEKEARKLMGSSYNINTFRDVMHNRNTSLRDLAIKVRKYDNDPKISEKAFKGIRKKYIEALNNEIVKFIKEKRAKKSIGDNDMNKAFAELTDFLKSTIENESQPTIGTGKEQGDAMGLAGKGANKGNPESGSSKPEVGNPPKPTVSKLSEDDEEDEKAMKPHKKPIEKSIPLNTWNQTEYMQREHRMYYDRHNSDDGIQMTFGKVNIKKSEESEVLSDDDQAAELVKSGRCIAAGNNSVLGFHNQLVQKHVCSNCEHAFMKALTVCPYCGH